MALIAIIDLRSGSPMSGSVPRRLTTQDDRPEARMNLRADDIDHSRTISIEH